MSEPGRAGRKRTFRESDGLAVGVVRIETTGAKERLMRAYRLILRVAAWAGERAGQGSPAECLEGEGKPDVSGDGGRRR